MQRNVILALGALAALGVGTWLVTQPDQSTDGDADQKVQVIVPQLSAQAQIGAQVFEQNCVQCHGVNAAGVDGNGPPLIHKIYEPSHHGDLSFLRAVQFGVRAHHWTFGDMAPVEGVSTRQAGQIVTYIREVQRANGIN